MPAASPTLDLALAFEEDDYDEEAAALAAGLALEVSDLPFPVAD
jgi:hypothetical protein